MENIYSQWQLDIWRVSFAIISMQPSHDLPKKIQIEYDANHKEYFVTREWW